MKHDRQSSITYVRADHHDITPAMPRAREAAKGVFDHVSILCWERSAEGLPPVEEHEGAAVRRFRTTAPPRGARIILTTFFYQLWVLRNLLRIRPDVVQVFDFYSAFPASAYAFFTRRDLIYDMRDPVPLCFRFPFGLGQLVAFLDWVLMATSRAFVVPASYRLDYLGRWKDPPRDVIVIPNTCHDEPERAPSSYVERSDTVVRIAVLGYLHGIRGIDALMELCATSGGGVELIVAGACRDQALRTMLETTDHVRFLERIPRGDALDLMAAVDLISLMYDTSLPVNQLAAPNKFYEAMMVGTPIICTEDMIIADDVRDHKLGFALPYADLAALQGAVATIRQPDSAAELRRCCRDYFERQPSLREELREYHDWYRKVVGR